MRISGWSSDVCSSDLSGDAEVMVRGGNTQFLEEDVRHVGVEMLPGVQHDLGNLVVARQGPAAGCRLAELRAGANDGDKLEHRATAPSRSAMKRSCWWQIATAHA